MEKIVFERKDFREHTSQSFAQISHCDKTPVPSGENCSEEVITAEGNRAGNAGFAPHGLRLRRPEESSYRAYMTRFEGVLC